MKLNEIPLELGVRREVSKTWSDGRKVEEIVYAFNRPALLKMEEILLAKTIGYWLNSVKEQPYFQSVPRRQISLKFYSNEIPALKRLGLYEFLFSRQEFPALGDGGGELGFYMSLDQIDQALAFLNKKQKNDKI